MLLTKNHVLVNEIAKQCKVAISNFSPLASDDRMIETESVIKSGGTMVIDKTSIHLPSYIRELACKTNHTNLEGLIMLNDMTEEFYLTPSQVKRIGEVISVEKKKFVKVSDDLLPIFSNPKLVIYPIDKDEIESPLLRDLIEKKQFKQIDKDTFLTWY